MLCSCGGKTRTIDTRHSESKHHRSADCEPGIIYRTRVCQSCSKRTQTMEISVDRIDDYDTQIERDKLRIQLAEIRKTVLELERITRKQNAEQHL